MAKRLNKKVAVLGTVVFLIMFVVFFVVVQEKDLLTSQAKLLEDGDAAMAKQDYETAKKKYLRAKSRSKTDELRIEAINRLIDLFLETEEWPPLRGLWEEMLRINPDDLAIRYAQFKNTYIIANSGVVRLWQDVETKASEFIDIVEREGIEDLDTNQWERPQYKEVGLAHESLAGGDGIQHAAQYLYLIRGKAKLQIVISGSTTEPDSVLEEAIQDLEYARELDPTNSHVILELSRAFIVRGNLLASRGNFEERDKASQMALSVIEKAIEGAPQDSVAYIRRLLLKQEIAREEDPEANMIALFEKDYLELAEQFPEDASVFAAVSSFYRSRGSDYLDKAITAIEKARILEPDNVMYSLYAASAYSLKAALKKDNSLSEKAISILNKSFESPEVQETEGPQRWSHRRNRITVYSYLTSVYFDRLLYSEGDLSPEQKQEWTNKAESIIHEIEQILGSGEDPAVMKWQGILALVKGDRAEGIRKLYAIYERLKSSDDMDTELAYVLAKTFENTIEVGAAHDFFASALKLTRTKENQASRAGSIETKKPSALLDYARVLLKLGAGAGARNAVTFFENAYGETSQSRMLMINSLISIGEFEEAEAILTDADIDEAEKLKVESQILQRKVNEAYVLIGRQKLADDPNIFDDVIAREGQGVKVEQLEKELERDIDQLADNIEEMVILEPNLVSESLVRSLCDRYIGLGQNDKVREIAQSYLNISPDSIAIQTYLRIINSGEPVTDERKVEVQKQLINEISDQTRKSFLLGMLSIRQNEPNEAISQFKKVISTFEQKSENITEDDPLFSRARSAAGYIFDLAVQTKDIVTAEYAADMAAKYNFDQCNGDYFNARLSAVKEDYEKALDYIEKCVEKVPLSSQILVLRGQIKEALGRTYEAIVDLKQAARFNPLNGNISKALAVSLYRRNEALGNNVTTEQFLEAKEAIERAISNNKNDIQLLSFYAEFIRDTEPRKALAIRQRLYKNAPTVANAVLLGGMAFELSEDQINLEEKQALMQIASDSYQKALQLAPDDQFVLSKCAEFYRKTGREQEAEQLLSGSQNEDVQWRYYLGSGQYSKAKEIMERIHASEPENQEVLAGLIEIARLTLNQDDAKIYSEKLCSVNDSVRNRLFQIQTYISVGLISEAEFKLQSFRERNPDEPLGQLLNAVILMRQGKLEEALELANSSLELDPTNSKGWLLRGRINLLSGDSTQAINDIMKSISYEDSAESRLVLARAYIAANRASEAVTELLNIVDDPASPEQSRLLLEAVYSNTENLNALASFYGDMIRQYPDDLKWKMKAAAFSMNTGNFDTAENLYKMVWDASVERGQPEAGALEGHIKTLLNAKKLQESMALCSKYINTEFKTVALVGMALTKWEMQDSASSIEHFRMAAESAKGDPTTVATILNVMYSVIGPGEVKKYCNEKLIEDPDSLVANYVLYNLSKIAGDYNKAIAFLDKCVAVSEDNSNDMINFMTEKGTLLAIAYQVYSDKKYLDGAVKTWEYLLEKSPKNSQLLNNIAYLLAEDGRDLEKAFKYAERAVQERPDNPGIIDTYAYVLYKNNRFEEAAEQAHASLQQYELVQAYAPAEVYQHLGMIMEKLGKNNEALVAYEKALELGGDSLSKDSVEQIKEALNRLNN